MKATVIIVGAIAWLASGAPSLAQDSQSALAASPATVSVKSASGMKRVKGVQLLGVVSLPTGYTYASTEVGGLSGITYNAAENVYYAISDDRSQINPARYYELSIDIEDGILSEGDVQFRGVHTLTDKSGAAYVSGGIDPEGIAWVGSGQLYISSEGDASVRPPLQPFVNRYRLTGKLAEQLPVPAKFRIDAAGSQGVRNNLAFESLTVTPDRHYLYTAVENALVQDGPAADLGQNSLCRVIKYDLVSRKPVAEYVYVADPVPEVPEPADSFRTNGLVELQALDNDGTLLALERGFSTGKGNTVKLFEVHTQGALDVSRQAALSHDGETYEIDPPVAKKELVNFADLGLTPDNLEGMALGPWLPDGRRVLIVVSDNNFSTGQITQFVALAVEFERFPAALPVLETPRALDDEHATSRVRGDSDDPAIWVHPDDPSRSLVIATQKDGGLVVFNLKGKILQKIEPSEYSGVRYNNVDLVYGFKLRGKPVDLAVVSDRENDTLAVFKILPNQRRLVDVTSPTMPSSIFGEDDGTHTAYGLATYTSPTTGKSYAYATQRKGNLVAQLELRGDGAGRVTAETVRTLVLPTPTGDAEDSQAEGMVADRELGYLYVGMEKQGILKFDAEPDGGQDYTVIHSIDADYLSPDVEGLTIYYGADGTGYLLASSQGDNTYAVFDRGGANPYLGSFVVAANHDIDQANESDGADVINVPLGPDFPLGLLVVQDGANDPQHVVEDDGELENNSTNFKFVPWQSVATAFQPRLLIDTTSYHPRAPGMSSAE